MTVAATWLRRLEIVLVIAGISLSGGAVAATVWRWHYQASQERALVQRQEALVQQRDAVVRQAQLAIIEGSQLAIPPVSIPQFADPFAFARIEIPRVGVSAIVREGVDEKTLALAVGHIEWTALPGEIGNIALAGHRDTFFRGLRNIRLDDRIRLDVPPHTYEYRVVSLEVVAPKETRVLEPTGGQELTLVTCHPFAFIGKAPNRFIVRATLVD